MRYIRAAIISRLKRGKRRSVSIVIQPVLKSGEFDFAQNNELQWFLPSWYTANRWRSRAPFSLFKLSALAGRALGVPIWEIKRSEIAFVNRRECAILGDTFGVPR